MYNYKGHNKYEKRYQPNLIEQNQNCSFRVFTQSNVQTYITQIGESESLEWGGGDSLDRERVRDIILADNDVQWG